MPDSKDDPQYLDPNQTFHILPLQWQKDRGMLPDYVMYTAQTAWGLFQIRRDRDSEDVHPWRLQITFDDYHDEEHFECKSLAAAKKQADAVYRKRLFGMLYYADKPRSKKGVSKPARKVRT